MREGYWAIICLGAALAGLTGPAAGAPRKEKVPRVKVEIRLAQREAAPGLEEMRAPGGGGTVYVHRRAALGNADIAEARAVRDAADRPAVEVVFAAGSRKAAAEFSRGNIGKVAAIFVDGKLVSAPTIGEEFAGKAAISGDFTPDEAERIAKGVTAD